ncbi:ABC transporter substrate-binding protein [Photobacterium proteolyticum]|uniref:ABC transporter substrate-binding protein n=1 Tax=Photobacterium proteolyticum TaxID=1903952 RepID=A0A1Q9GMS1_9GAMM|nr:TRAP transporter substrate-binding protein [Photobacterium proteolyticum]OLQ75954.1 ABC transporter substrate-binding protein [Photobacterium proteolyticum]
MIQRSRKIVIGLVLAMGLAGCGEQGSDKKDQQVKAVEWKLVTSWPKGFPGLGLAPERFADKVNALSGGRLIIKVYGAGELVPSFDVFNAVSKGTAQMGHSAAFYWQDKIPAASFFSATPFGMTAQEMNAWLHYGGGLELWQELYEPYGVIPMAGGNTGAQMGGWFNKEINTLADLKGLKMRLPGFAADVLKRAGGIPVSLPGGELFTALETGAIDATEWVGPYNDLAFGLHNAARYYYYPGWQEPSTTLEFLVNKNAYQALPDDLKQIIEVAARAINQDMLDEYMVKNVQALDVLVNEHGVEIRLFPKEVLAELKLLTQQLMNENSASDPDLGRIYASYSQFLADIRQYGRVSDNADVNID